MNPYQVLGIRNDASDKVIRRTYRKKSMEHHPDRNPGDEQAKERFSQVHLAYQVLTDPARRAKYDSTGTIDQTVPDSRTSLILTVLAGAFSHVYGETQKFQMLLSHLDLVSSMVKAIQTRKKAHQDGLGNLDKLTKDIKEALTRIEDKAEEQLLHLVLQGQLHQATCQATSNQQQIEYCDLALKYLEGCKSKMPDDFMSKMRQAKVSTAFQPRMFISSSTV